jgi:hypothetical protein
MRIEALGLRSFFLVAHFLKLIEIEEALLTLYP